MRRRPRVIVCGTKFGRVYLSAFRMPDFPFELAGILAQGSARSQACAKSYGVPLFRSVAELPSNVDIACVVVGSGPTGGHGLTLAKDLMTRGVHVLQEHPLHHDELTECLRHASQHGVTYRINTHYIHLDPVRQFLRAAQALLRRQRPLFVDAMAAVQTAYSLADILGRALGSIRPWGLSPASEWPAALREQTTLESPFRSLTGVIAGVPLTIRIQNQLDPRDPDNYIHLFHRIAIGTESGHLTLINTHGPTVWSSRPHLPADSRETVTIEESKDVHLDLPSATAIGDVEGPNYRKILADIWPRGIYRALRMLTDGIDHGDRSPAIGQYYLEVSRFWHDLTTLAGPVSLVQGRVPIPLSLEALLADSGEEG